MLNIVNDEYIYAVARIRCKEEKLFSKKDIDQMLAIDNKESVVRFLSEAGWDTSVEDEILIREERRLWMLIEELVDDLSSLDFLRINKDFQNLKVAVKGFYINVPVDDILVYGGITDPKLINEAIKEKNFLLLPDYLKEFASLALKTLLKTTDAQLCDILIDKACLEAVYALGKNSRIEIIQKYCETFVAIADIKIAVRGLFLLKNYDFILNSMAECNSLDVKSLALSATKSIDDICSYLLTTEYKTASSLIKSSLESYECWCDNYIMNLMKKYKSDPFSLASLIAYIYAKETEIKTVRLILTAKSNHLDNKIIRERVRELYV